ncbi:MAG: adenylyl cyclase [Jatrophihabitans sp.]|uniref:adenylyl cyclase n=1 Tax=Jatrophihabitans sp. TaxID=1932789 RepID=UPI003F7F1B1C
MNKLRAVVLATVAATALAGSVAVATPATARPPAGAHHPGRHLGNATPDLGPNVYVFDPSMSTASIQSTVDAIANQQLTNQFGTQRYALLFKPGTYGTATHPLNFQVGYYTEVAGLGRNPGDVTINGSVDVHNQCDASGSCIALNNFWRSLSNLTINVHNVDDGCTNTEFWAVSQAAPMRRVHVTNGNTTLMDYCTSPSFASGGFIADSRFDGTVINGSQQQFFVRNSDLSSFSNGVWNQVFAGDNGAPAECFPASDACGGPYTTVARTPISRERPYLYVDGRGTWQVFVPSARQDSVGTTWADGSTPGRSVPLSRFYLARPSDNAQVLDNQLSRGRNLLLTPDVYDITRSLEVKRADTVVLGLGFPTLTADHGAVPIQVADVPGVDLAGMIIDAGAANSSALAVIGTGHPHHRSALASDPTALQDVFFRIAGPHAGRATNSLIVNSDHVILDDIWAWRADHGTGVGWTQNTADHGLIVNGSDVDATGLFVEHYQKHEVVWNGAHGSVIFFQNEMPYDPPSQAAWNSAPGTLGYAAMRFTRGATGFRGYGLGSYSFFNQHVDIYASHAFEAVDPHAVHLHNLLTIFLDPANGSGGIRHVVDNTGGSSTKANPDTPVTVTDYP